LISTIEPPATLDGGDVMYTGKDIFVGLTRRTNTNAIEQISKWFNNTPVHTIPCLNSLHLKCVVTPYDENTLIVAEKEGEQFQDYIKQNCNTSYRLVLVPDIIAANIVRIGDTIVIQDGFPKSEEILKKLAHEDNVKVISLPMSELIKADGCLTCGSILFNIS